MELMEVIHHRLMNNLSRLRLLDYLQTFELVFLYMMFLRILRMLHGIGILDF